MDGPAARPQWLQALHGDTQRLRLAVHGRVPCDLAPLGAGDVKTTALPAPPRLAAKRKGCTKRAKPGTVPEKYCTWFTHLVIAFAVVGRGNALRAATRSSGARIRPGPTSNPRKVRDSKPILHLAPLKV